MSRKEPDANRQIFEEASTWFVACRTQDMDENARQDFQDWLKRSPEHIRAYLEIASTYADIPAPESGRTPPELIARARSNPDINVVCLSAGQISAGSLAPTRPAVRDPVPWKERFTGWRVTATAVMLVVAAAGTWLYAERNTYGTGVGERRALTLPDGSIVELNARSRVRVAIRAHERVVELLSGQALFRVAKDRNRPFVVHAGATSVRAVGTQFDVYRRSTGTTVTVLEGRVAVLSSVTPSAQVTGIARESAVPEPPTIPRQEPTEHEPEVLLAAGEQLTVTSNRAVKAERPNIAAATAWTQHQLVFDATPLSEVVEEFSRYNTRRLIIDSSDLATLEISGQYTSASPESLLKFLSLQEGVVVTQVNGEIHIRKE